MRIVIATAVYYPMVNGVAVFSHNLAEGLAKRGHDVVVITPSRTGKNYIKNEGKVRVAYLKSVQAKVYPDQIHPVVAKRKIFGIEMPHLFYRHGFRVSVFPQIEIKKILDEFRPDVVHVQVSDPIGLSVVAYARRNHVPVVTTEHNQPEVITDPLKIPAVAKKPVNVVLSAYFRNRQSKSDFVTMPTKQAIENLIYANGKKFSIPIAAVSNGVDLACFGPGEAEESLYKKYKIPQNRPVVLYVGRVDPEKQVGTVIQAFWELLHKIPKALLLVVGDGVDKSRLRKEIKKMGIDESVKFLGRVLPPDLYELYKVGDLFVTASEIETQGIVLIEAAACGLPLVAVDKGAVAEVCQDEVNGFLCEPGNSKEISEAMVKILSDEKLRAKFSKNSLKIAAEHDFEKTLDKFINIYNRVISVVNGKVGA